MFCRFVNALVIATAYSLAYIHHFSRSDLQQCLWILACKPVVKPSAASTSSDVTASTSEAPVAYVTAPSTDTALKLSPPSAGTAPPHAVSNLNKDLPPQPVLASYPKHAFSRMTWIKEKDIKKHIWMIYYKYWFSFYSILLTEKSEKKTKAEKFKKTKK